MPKAPKETPEKPSFIDTAYKSLDHLNSRSIQVALLGALAISVVSVVLVNFFGGVERLHALLQAAGPLAPVAFVLLKASTYVIAPLSGTPVKLAAGALFGFWEGALLAMAGDVLGATLNFWIARLFRVKAIEKLAGKKALKQIDETAEHVGGWRALLFARLFLSSLYDFVSYAAGLSNMRFWQFITITIIAGIPSNLMAAWLGDSLVSNQPLFFGLMGLGALSIVLVIVANKFLNASTKK